MGNIMQEWNAVINVNESGFKRAFVVLGEFGHVRKTDFFNVLVIKADDIHQMLETLRNRSMEDPEYLSFLSRLIPVTTAFTFQSPEEFEIKARDVVLTYIPELAGKGFHVRMRRRGFKGKLSGLEEEQFLDKALMESLEKSGHSGHITFENPDAIIAVETVAQWAGMSLWKREDLERYPFIRLN
jgi:tRNA(Ser,Leu) C12 N-acetylase TAN1